MLKKRASIHDLAQQLQLSPSTVSRALNGHREISAYTTSRVVTLARELNYQPNSVAASLRRGRSQQLGVVVPCINGHFLSQVLQGIEAAASKAGYHLLICQSNEEAVRERTSLTRLLNAQVDGILVSPVCTTADFQGFEQVREQGVPLVFFDRVPPGWEAHAVVLDDQLGGYLATVHLLDQGYRHIAHFAGPAHLTTYRCRRLGYEQALRERGLPVRPELIVTGDLQLETTALGLRQLLALPQPPDAAFAASDFVAAELLETLYAQGRRVPQEFGLVGFSNEQFARLTSPKLTSIEQHGELMGNSAARLLLELLHKPASVACRKVVLQPELLVRDSSQRLAA